MSCNEQGAKIVWSENISTPIHVKCNKMYQSKVCVQEFWYFVPGLDIQPEQSKQSVFPTEKKWYITRNVLQRATEKGLYMKE